MNIQELTEYGLCGLLIFFIFFLIGGAVLFFYTRKGQEKPLEKDFNGSEPQLTPDIDQANATLSTKESE